MGYYVRTIDDRATLRDFLAVPLGVYAGDPHWVRPMDAELRRTLDARKNPYFSNGSVRLFVCYDERRPVGRVAIIINHYHWEKFGERTAFFGFFDCVNDERASEALFGSVISYCRANDVEFLEGPFNPSHYSELGFLANHFDAPPSFFQSYNPPYYVYLFERAGFTILKRIHTRKNAKISEYVRSRYPEALAAHANSGEYVVRPFRMDDFENELERIRTVFNDAFSDNWHFLPLSREEYLFSAKFLHLVTDPQLVVIAERNGEPAGVVECVLDINPLLKPMNGRIGPVKYFRYQRDRKKIRNLMVYAVGIRKALQRTRVHKLLFDALCRIVVDYDTLETTWMSDDNILSVRAAEHFGLLPEKEFVILGKKVG